MSAPRLLAVLVAAGLLLAGCADGPEPTPTPTPVASESPSPTPTAEESTASAIVVSLDSITVRDQNGVELRSATFDGPDATLALVSDLLGSTPEPVDNRQFGMFYEWPEITVVVNFGTSSVTVSSPTVAGLPISTGQGIHVGSSRAEVEALAPFTGTYDGDGDGLPDILGLEQVAVPEFDSLTYPGQPGTAYIRVTVNGQEVTSIGGPSGDYLDI